MDTLRSDFDPADNSYDSDDFGIQDSNLGSDMMPSAIGQDERRMQVRAYNHWASLLGDRRFPDIDGFEPEHVPDFGPYGVLIEFDDGIEDPSIRYVGEKLAVECELPDADMRLSDVPSRSLLSRITDHYMQILANDAPIGFEAEFVNQQDRTILYRGILLPFSSDDESIDFIYGVINWKEVADQSETDRLMEEVDQALSPDASTAKPAPAPLTEWADSPSADPAPIKEDDIPAPAFGSGDYFDDDVDEDEPEEASQSALYNFASLSDHIAPPSLSSVSIDETGANDTEEPLALDGFEQVDNQADLELGLHDCLASARELAQNARSCEDRSRDALYSAVGRAYDFSLLAAENKQEYDELIEEAGLSVQERAPMTPIVKLVFGADYDKTRLTEYAAVLSHAQRLSVERGELSKFLREAEGGLKGVVTAERRLRKEESGKTVEPLHAPREALAKKLRALETQSLDALNAEGAEFGLVMIRRTEEGKVVMLGEINEDVALIERVARKLTA